MLPLSPSGLQETFLLLSAECKYLSLTHCLLIHPFLLIANAVRIGIIPECREAGMEILAQEFRRQGR